MIPLIKRLTEFSLTLLGVRLVKCNIDANSSDDDDRGFGKLFKWVKFENAFTEAKIQSKPIFLIIHRQTCPVCLALKARFAKSVRIFDLSSEFVMVNVENGVETLDNQDKYQPDGKYVPRILFFTPDGELIREAYNKDSCAEPEYRYFHKMPSSIVQTMRFVLQNQDKLFNNKSSTE